MWEIHQRENRCSDPGEHTSRVQRHQKHLGSHIIWFMVSLFKKTCWFWVCMNFLFPAGKMRLNILARPLHLGLLALCIAVLCSEPVSAGNQSSRGQTGECQTQPDRLQPPWGTHYSPWSPAWSPGVEFNNKNPKLTSHEKQRWIWQYVVVREKICRH